MTGYGDNGTAVVEYIGVHVQGGPHGNCKEPENHAPYGRTTQDTMAKAESRSLNNYQADASQASIRFAHNRAQQ